MARPAQVAQGAAAELNAALQQALVLAVQRQVIAELVDQHPGQEADIGHALLQHVGRRRGGDDAQVIEELVDRAGVLEDHVAARALRQAVGDLLADAHAPLRGDGLDLGVGDRDDLARHILAEAQARVIDRGIARLGPALIADRLGGRLWRRWRCCHTQGR